MTINITIGSSSPQIDLPAWLQAGAAFVAVAVTAWQWWSAKEEARREKRARQMAAFGVMMNVHAALTFQRERLAQVGAASGPNSQGRYARAMLDAGFELMERSIQAIPIVDLPLRGVEAVMAAQSAVHGARQALEGMADQTDEPMNGPAIASSLEYLDNTLGQLQTAAEMLRAAVEEQA